jgi:hypothetical protein
LPRELSSPRPEFELDDGHEVDGQLTPWHANYIRTEQLEILQAHLQPEGFKAQAQWASPKLKHELQKPWRGTWLQLSLGLEPIDFPAGIGYQPLVFVEQEYTPTSALMPVVFDPVNWNQQRATSLSSPHVSPRRQ